jgi:hypothetical protein
MARTAQISTEKGQSIQVSQYGTFKDVLHFLQVQSQKLALMRTTTGKDDPELPLLQRISSLQLTTVQVAAQINASHSSSNRHLNINCSEETW